MEIQFNTHYNRSHSEPETIIGPSMTEPEECLSIPEILSRYIRSGIKVDASYQGDLEDPDGTSFDDSWKDFDPVQEPLAEPSEEAQAKAQAEAPAEPPTEAQYSTK